MWGNPCGFDSRLEHHFWAQPSLVPARRRRFTFLEVLIAVAILGVSLAMILQIIGGARARLLRGERRWANQHLLTQATELFLLGGATAESPDGLLPPHYSARCDLAAAENLPSHAENPIDGWALGVYHVSVTGRRGDVVADVTVEKVVRQEDLQ